MGADETTFSNEPGSLRRLFLYAHALFPAQGVLNAACNDVAVSACV